MTIIIGNKSTFAIEADIERREPAPFGGVRVWLEDRYIGAYEDAVPILTFLSRLKRVFDLYANPDSEFLQSREMFFDGVMNGTMRDGDRYRLGLGESFDDFFLIGFRVCDVVQIIWSLHEEPFFAYPDYPRGIQSASVSADAFKQVVDRFEYAIAGGAE